MRFMGLMTSGNTGDFGGNLNEIHGQPFDKLKEYPIRGKRHNFFSPDMGPACANMGLITHVYCMKPYKMKAPNCALFSVAHAVCYIFPWKI